MLFRSLHMYWLLCACVFAASAQMNFGDQTPEELNKPPAPHKIDQCSICTAVVDTVRESLTDEEWAGNIPTKRWSSKKFAIGEWRALEAMENLCERMMKGGNAGKSSSQEQGDEVRYALVIDKGIGKFMPTTSEDGTIPLFHGEVVRHANSNQPLYHKCGVIVEEHEEEMVLKIMKGQAHMIPRTLCVEELGVCTAEYDGFLKAKLGWETNSERAMRQAEKTGISQGYGSDPDPQQGTTSTTTKEL